MPDYEHEAELAALLDPAVRQAAGRAWQVAAPQNPLHQTGAI